MTLTTIAPQNAVTKNKRTDDTSSQWAVLALARFLLASIVMVSHSRIITGQEDIIYHCFDVFGSHAAVAAFFLISGYSIASSLEREPHQFYARRFWRIYPPYLFAIGISLLAFVALGNTILIPYDTFTAPNALVIAGNLLFLQSVCIPLLDINSPIWSIAVEVFYYSIAPILQKLKPVLIGALIFVSAAVYASGLHPNGLPYAKQQWEFSALAWAWLWLLGFGIYNRQQFWRWVIVLLPVALFCLHDEQGGALSPFTVAAVGMVLANARNMNIGNATIRHLFNYLGDLSYPLYLVHVPVSVWIWGIFHTKCSPVYFLTDLAVAALALHLWDKPFRYAWKSGVKPRSIVAALISATVLTSCACVVQQKRLQQEAHVQAVIQKYYDDLVAAEQSYDFDKYHEAAAAYMSPGWRLASTSGASFDREGYLDCYKNSLRSGERFRHLSYKVNRVLLNGHEAVDEATYSSDFTRTEHGGMVSPANKVLHGVETVKVTTHWKRFGSRWVAMWSSMQELPEKPLQQR